MPTFRWRPLTSGVLSAVEAIATAVHPDFFEDAAIFAERQRLYAAGCHLLELDGAPAGYVLSHPWRFGILPALNTLLGTLPAGADTFYIHDLALCPAARGSGAAASMVRHLLDHAAEAGFATASLVAVNGSVPFWSKQGFAVQERAELTGKLQSYEAGAKFMARSLL